jgi:hypothetical protein
MKKIFLGLLLLPFLILSCEGILDKQPLDQISETTFWETPQDAVAGLNACYDALQTIGDSKNLCDELMGMLDCLTPVGNSRDANTAAIANGNVDPTNNRIYQWWTAHYRGIVRCNDFLDHIEGIEFPSNDAGKKERMTAEVKFLRAFYYFQLVDYFGDVPLIVHMQKLQESQVPRDSKDKIITAMLEDLNYAVGKLPVSYPPADAGHVTSGAAKTLKLKYQMMTKDFAAAAVTAKEIMDTPGYSLLNNYPAVFSHTNENNAEVIFDIQFISFVGDGSSFDKLWGNRSASANGWSWIHPTLWLVDKFERIDPNPVYEIKDKRIPAEIYNYFEGRDPRMDWTIVRPGAYFTDNNGKAQLYPYQIKNYAHSQTGMHLRKNVIEGPDGIADDSPGNWIIFRLADVMLLYAEAKTQSAYSGGALVTDPDIYEAINDIRKRASAKLPLYAIGTLTKEAMLERIYDERIRELAFEGWLTSDLKRWKRLELNSGLQVRGLTINNTKVSFSTTPIVVRDFKAHYYTWPIPQSEIDVNPKLIQTTGYN